jgi:hypothetical protein
LEFIHEFVHFASDTPEKNSTRKTLRAYQALPASNRGRVTRDRCYDFLNIFAEKFSKKIGVFDSKQS